MSDTIRRVGMGAPTPEYLAEKRREFEEHDAKGLCHDFATTNEGGGWRMAHTHRCTNRAKWLLIYNKGSAEIQRRKVCGVHKRTAIGRYYPQGLKIEALT